MQNMSNHWFVRTASTSSASLTGRTINSPDYIL